MSSINDGGPAFPRTKSTGYLGSSVAEIISVGGMSLRDYFAGQAMQAIISKHPPTEEVSGINEIDRQTARGAYEYADAMLKAREVKP